MDDIQIQQGETIRQTVTVEETGAATAEFIATDGVDNVVEVTSAFSDLTADISTNDTIIPAGTYDYYIRITWDDDSVDILPNAQDCDGECEFPKLIVCAVPGVS